MSSYELGAEVPHEEVDDLESENIQSWREGNESTRFDEPPYHDETRAMDSDVDKVPVTSTDDTLQDRRYVEH
jgi:hypothetical protein